MRVAIATLGTFFFAVKGIATDKVCAASDSSCMASSGWPPQLPTVEERKDAEDATNQAALRLLKGWKKKTKHKVTTGNFDGERGLAAAQDLSMGDVVIRLPSKFMITPSDYNWLNEELDAQRLTDFQLLAMGLMYETRTPSSKALQAYVESLPRWWQHANAPFFDETMLDLITSHGDQRNKVQQIEENEHMLLRAGKSLLSPPPARLEVRWAIATVESRVFFNPFQNPPTPVLWPLVDYANQPMQEQAGVCAQINNVDGALEMSVDEALPAGGQVFICYDKYSGGSENFDLLLSSGFHLGPENHLGPRGNLLNIFGRANAAQLGRLPEGCDSPWRWDLDQPSALPATVRECAERWVGHPFTVSEAIKHFCNARIAELSTPKFLRAYDALIERNESTDDHYSWLAGALIDASNMRQRTWERCVSWT